MQDWLPTYMCSIFPNKCTHSEFWVRSKRKKSRRDERKSRDKSREEWSVQCSPIGITITLRMSFSIKASAQRYIHFKTVIIQPRFKKKRTKIWGTIILWTSWIFCEKSFSPSIYIFTSRLRQDWRIEANTSFHMLPFPPGSLQSCKQLISSENMSIHGLIDKSTGKYM